MYIDIVQCRETQTHWHDFIVLRISASSCKYVQRETLNSKQKKSFNELNVRNINFRKILNVLWRAQF